MKKPNLVLIHVDQWRGDCLGTVVDRPTLLSDIVPTFADLAGVAAPASCTGVSLLRQLDHAAPVRSHVHIEHAMLVAGRPYRNNLPHAVTDFDEEPADIATYCAFKGVGPWR